jgi:molybdate transport system substrate-binding protein
MTFASVATGVDIAVIAGGATKSGLDFVATAFQKETGHAVKVNYSTGLQALKRMDDGEVFDVVIGSTDSIKRVYRPAGRVEEDGISIGRVGLGVMIRPDAPVPDISSAAALKLAVLEADSILYTEESSGLRIEAMLKKMGVYEQVEAKTTRYSNGLEFTNHVLKGRGKELAFLPITVILTQIEKGLVLVGPLPEELQYYLELIAVPSIMSTNKEIAWEFVRFCAGPGKPLLVAHGFKGGN